MIEFFRRIIGKLTKHKAGFAILAPSSMSLSGEEHAFAEPLLCSHDCSCQSTENGTIYLPDGSEVIPFPLVCRFIPPFKGIIVADGRYVVNLEDQTCTCGDFERRKDEPLDQFSRWCKHLIFQLDRKSAFDKENQWLRVIAKDYSGGAVSGFIFKNPATPDFFVTGTAGNTWVNVYANSRKKQNGVFTPTGEIRCYGWNTLEKRWSYRSPPAAAAYMREMLKILTLVDEK